MVANFLTTINKIYKNNKSFFIYIFINLITFTVVTIFLFNESLKIINADAIEYYSVANQYHSGHILEAINGIWSPLLSWLLVIFQFASLTGNISYRLIMLLCALFILVLSWFVIKKLHPKPSVYILIISSFFIQIWLGYMAYLSPVTPDILSVIYIFIFTLLLTIFINRKIPGKSFAIYFGIIGGFGLISKTYLFYFTIATLLLLILLMFIENKNIRKNHIKISILSIGMVLVFSTPWIIAISIKYGQFTISPIAKYSMSVISPTYSPPPLTLGLMNPPNELSVTAREDLTKMPGIEIWQPFSSSENLKHYISYIFKVNMPRALYLAWPALLLLCISSYILISRRRVLSSNNRILGSLLILMPVIYIGGYMIQHLEGGIRYIWPVYILAFFSWLTLIKYANNFLKYTSLLAVIICAIYPLWISSEERAANKGSWIITENILNDIKKFDIPEKSKIASNDPYTAGNICYILDLKCYGKPKDISFESELLSKDINYYFEINAINTFRCPAKKTCTTILYSDSVNVTVIR